ncbi:hypothetical protein ATANTOWER_030035 [Ataeniobius toweri]|uniref:Ig-like domain-containing protein n=1 Tax=Ataeniobius toweri TaxID=208326 RepID=A0ABU7B0V9_9TELE|nr:hypothetical protein [Ataeniobius toweri]
MTLHHVTSSDEGLYKCNISGHGESPSSRISVAEKPQTMAPHTLQTPPTTVIPPTTVAPPLILTTATYLAPPPVAAAFQYRLVCHLVVFCPYFMSTLLMLSLYQRKSTGSKRAASMVMTPPTHEEQGLDDDYDDVTTEHNF